jgi:hypothetical protein
MQCLDSYFLSSIPQVPETIGLFELENYATNLSEKVKQTTLDVFKEIMHFRQR